jgi:hypothetical protein
MDGLLYCAPVAIITLRVISFCPLSSSIWCGRRSQNELVDAVSDDHLGAELLCLVERTRCEFHTRNTSGKPQVVLDFGARSCLTSGGIGLNYQHAETFRSGVNRRRKPDGPAPTTITSRTCDSSTGLLKPRQSATCCKVGFRRAMVPRYMRTGISLTLTLNRSSNSWAWPSVSRSTSW